MRFWVRKCCEVEYKFWLSLLFSPHSYGPFSDLLNQGQSLWFADKQTLQGEKINLIFSVW